MRRLRRRGCNVELRRNTVHLSLSKKRFIDPPVTTGSVDEVFCLTTKLSPWRYGAFSFNEPAEEKSVSFWAHVGRERDIVLCLGIYNRVYEISRSRRWRE